MSLPAARHHSPFHTFTCSLWITNVVLNIPYSGYCIFQVELDHTVQGQIYVKLRDSMEPHLLYCTLSVDLQLSKENKPPFLDESLRSVPFTKAL